MKDLEQTTSINKYLNDNNQEMLKLLGESQKLFNMHLHQKNSLYKLGLSSGHYQWEFNKSLTFVKPSTSTHKEVAPKKELPKLKRKATNKETSISKATQT